MGVMDECDKCHGKGYLTDEELWKIAGTDKPITRDMLGIKRHPGERGLQTLKEGFDVSDDSLFRYIAIILAVIVFLIMLASYAKKVVA